MESIPVLTTAKEKIAIITITRPGLEKAAALLKGLDATLYVSERYAGEAPEGAVIFDGVVKNLLPGLFDSYDGIILVMALGIVVRTIAPLIVDKKRIRELSSSTSPADLPSASFQDTLEEPTLLRGKREKSWEPYRSSPPGPMSGTPSLLT
jgi:hypothetical protein